VDFVWSWPIERRGEARTVSVGLASGSAELVADESRHAVDTLGRSAVTAVLDRDDPPRRITIISTGVRHESD
jgi:hypothetical protein